MKKYVIINTSKLSSVNYNLVEQDSINTVRKSLDKSLSLISFVGNTPSFLKDETQYDKQGIKEILESADWHVEELSFTQNANYY